MIKFLIFTALLLLVSCAGTTGRTFNELHEGMPQEAAMAKLGQADEVTQKGEYEMHTYKDLFGAASSESCSKCSTRIVKTDYYVVYKSGQVVKVGTKHPH